MYKKDETIGGSILAFANFVAESVKSATGESEGHPIVLGSNEFKTEKLYQVWCDYAKQNAKVKQWQEELKQILGEKSTT